jgi:hypothetical protein
MFVNVVPGTVFVKPIPLRPGDVGLVEVGGFGDRNGFELSPAPGDGVLNPVPGLMVLVCGAGVGDVPIIPVEDGFPTIPPGAVVSGVVPTPGAVPTPAPPLVTPVAEPEDAADGVEAAPAAVGTAGCPPVVP